MRFHQKAGPNQRCCRDRANHKVDDRRKEARTRANTGTEQAQLEAPPRVDPTEGRLAALKGTVPGNLHLPVATWNTGDREEKSG